MKQYNQVKTQYPGALLLFRVGDFYETFGEDAIKTSKILDIVLTKRSNGGAAAVELAGFPHHALDTHLPKLIKAGHRVAICDQLEDPKLAKGIVKRGVTELVTPGLAFNDQVLDQKYNNYLASLYFDKDELGIAFLDVSTGEFLVAQGTMSYVDKLVQSFKPSEIISSKKQQKDFQTFFKDQCNSHFLEEWVYHFDYAYEILNGHFGTASLKGFGIEQFPLGIIAAGAVLRYLEETEHKKIKHITSIARIEEDKYVWLDRFTIRNLELLDPQQEEGVALIHVLDKTVTPMGARLMKKWVVLPLKDIHVIRRRLDTVEVLVKNPTIGQNILQALKQVGDLERLISKVSVGRANPRELLALKKALQQIAPIQRQLQSSTHELLLKLSEQLHRCDYLLEKIEKTLQENPPLLTNQGGLIREGFHEELDALKQIAHTGKDYLVEIQQKESKKTGIASLKVAYNKVFGYYLEVTHTHKAKVPANWIRKQTLVNAERYVTEELKHHEEKIAHAEERLTVLEQKLYQELVSNAADFVPQIQQNARVLAQLDCYLSFAQEARKHHYTKPVVNEDKVIEIQAGRHPVIEQQLPLDERYVPNDIYLDNTTQQIIIITGPNMAGKSALLRQVALIVLMTQIGAFVPADSASIGLVDKVFTRVGASDNLARGESTFMTEMTETASIMHNLSDRSLVLLDEIGRGTSTYDGISIAWSIVEYLHSHAKCRAKTLFATHYHELNQLADELERVKNFHVAVKEINEKVLFLRQLRAGGSAHSFGIHVAQMAGMPAQVVHRADALMHHLEQGQSRQRLQEKIQNIPANSYQLSLFEADPAVAQIKTLLKDLDINVISPMEALLKLSELKGLLDKNS
ncbi:MAG: DNA mismatch repair protein MutS [Amoebophilaceae bacterium]|jgi:DNA mismatch repair protein MutS|nr:DNA mismatch repair protein MutS [Amoebophilaceae bacterium]